MVLDNKTTAMTGHQPHPGMDKDIMGNPTFGQDIEKVLQGFTKGEDVSIARVNPEKREDYRAVVGRNDFGRRASSSSSPIRNAASPTTAASARN